MTAEDPVRAHARRQRQLQSLLAALLVIAVVIGIVLGATGGSGDGRPAAAKTGGGAVPPPSQPNLEAAARAAGCVLRRPKLEGAGHTTKPVDYDSNPPTSGPHHPFPALDGIYAPGKEPAPEHYVHSLEHGRVEVQYAPGTSPALVSQLETLVSEPLHGKDAYKVLLFENDTNMPYAVAATAWGRLLGCRTVRKPAIFDAIRDFRAAYVDQGPERGIPPTN